MTDRDRPWCTQRLRELQTQGKNSVLRVIVDAGGCHGFKTTFALVNEPDENEMCDSHVMRWHPR